jgi:hypothetical protein
MDGGSRTLNFEVNGETYFVSLAEDERQWLVYVSTPEGPRPIPVYVDAAEMYERPLLLEDSKKSILN